MGQTKRVTNSQAATHESWLVRCSPHTPEFSWSNWYWFEGYRPKPQRGTNFSRELIMYYISSSACCWFKYGFVFSEIHCGKAQVGSTLNLCPRFNPRSPELNPGRRSNSGPDIFIQNLYLSVFIQNYLYLSKLLVYIELLSIITSKKTFFRCSRK